MHQTMATSKLTGLRRQFPALLFVTAQTRDQGELGANVRDDLILTSLEIGRASCRERV